MPASPQKAVYIHSFNCQQHGIAGTVDGYFITSSLQVSVEEVLAALDVAGYDRDLIPGDVCTKWRIRISVGDADSQTTRRNLWSRVLEAWESKYVFGKIIRQELAKKGGVRNILCISY